MDRTTVAHLKRHGPPNAAVVVAVTNGRLDGSTEAPPEPTEGVAKILGSWERILCQLDG